MKKFFQDFKAFITKGNIVDMAVGVIIGAAFSAIVTSLVNDIIMPLIGWAFGGFDVSDLVIVLSDPKIDSVTGEVIRAACEWRYGNFLQAVLNFLIIALCIFVVLRIFMSAKKSMEKAQEGYKMMGKKEYKALVKEMKAKGCKKAEIQAAVAAREAELTAQAKAEEERKAAEAKANAPETSEDILKDIRELLLKQSQGSQKQE